MMIRCFAAALFALTSLGRADVTLRLTHNGTEESARVYASGSAIDDLPSLDDSYSMVRVYAGSSDEIGPITLTGSRSNRLDVLIAASSVTSFPTNSANLLSSGAHGLDGLSPAASMVGVVRLACSVSGPVSGQVDCGQVFRIQSGTIEAPIIAHAADSVADGPAIRSVAVTTKITSGGRVEASSGGILNMDLGTGSSGDGLFGSVIASGGRVETLTVRGEITIASPARIEAADGIGGIQCTFLSDAGFVPGPIDATINANAANHTSGSLGHLTLFECYSLAGGGVSALAIDPPHASAAISVDGLVSAPIVTGSLAGDVLVGGFVGSGALQVNGNLSGSVIASSGDITSIDVTGNFGSQAGPVRIESVHDHGGAIRIGGNVGWTTLYDQSFGASLLSAQGFDEVSCASMHRTVVSAQAGAPVRIGAFRVRGDMVGSSVNCGDFNSFRIDGSLLYDPIVGPEQSTIRFLKIDSDRTVLIGGSWNGDNQFRVEDELGLHGQVIVGAGGAGAVSESDVEVRGHNSGPFPTWLSVAFPEYPWSAAELGGGAVGLVPFHFHNLDCVPRNNVDPPVLLDTGFNGVPTSGSTALLDRVHLEFEGPIRAEHSFISPLTVEMYVQPHNGTPYWKDITTFVDIDVPRPGDGRVQRWLDIRGNTTPLWFPATQYRVRPRTDSHWNGRRLLCDGLFSSAPTVPVADFTYTFELGLDCDANGVWDTMQIQDDPALDQDLDGFLDVCFPHTGTCGSADFNCDGDTGTDADIEAFFACMAGNCPASPCSPRGADFNGDGDTGTDADIEAFFHVLAGGNC